MTVTSDLARVQYSGNGVTTVFSTGFAFQSNLDVKVILTDDATQIETVGALNVHYTLTGAMTENPGSCTTFQPVPVGTTLTIIRNVQFIQDLDGTVLSTMDAGDQEIAYDKIWHALSQLKEAYTRTIHTSDGAVDPFPGTWVPIIAVVAVDPTREVLQVTGWTGGTGDTPTAGMYLGPVGYVTDITQAVNIKGSTGIPGPVGPVGATGSQGPVGPPGPAGSGAGDMLRSQNLNDLIDKAASRTNLGLGNSATRNVGTTAGTVAAGDDSRLLLTGPLVALSAPAIGPLPDGQLWFESDTGFLYFLYNDGNTRQWVIVSPQPDTSTYALVSALPVAASAAEYMANGTNAKFVSPNTAWAAAAPVALVDAATVTPDFNTGLDFTWTIGAAGRTFANPTNVKNGQKGVIYLTQDATGNRTITTWGSNWKFPGGTKPVLSTAANAVDALAYSVSGTLIYGTFSAGFA